MLGACGRNDRSASFHEPIAVNKQYEIPQTLWLYWHQGWGNAPSIVKRCLRSWEEKNPTWVIHKLDASTIWNFVHLPSSLRDEPALPLCALSDLIRINLLYDYGGVWTDATVFCQRPLDEWIYYAARTGFFAFDRPGPGRPLASWFIASAARHDLVKEWKKRACCLWIEEDYLNKSRALWSDWTADSYPQHYFWFHRLFQKMIEEDQVATHLWGGVEKISADGPHFVQHRGMFKPLTVEVKDFIDREMSPVHKLTYRYDVNYATANSSLDYLLAR